MKALVYLDPKLLTKHRFKPDKVLDAYETFATLLKRRRSKFS